MLPPMTTQATSPVYDGPANWKGSEIKDSDQWHFHLTQAHVDEVKSAVQKSMVDGIEIVDIKQKNFELPTLGVDLDRLYQGIVFGRGFVVCHGMPVADFNREEVIRAWVGVGSHLGEPVSQNAKGHIIGHVKDLQRDPTHKNQRTFGTNERQPYHTDSCDIVGLLCLKTPRSGGLFSLTSSIAVYNEMMQRRPDLVKILEQPFVHDRRGEVPEGKEDTFEMAAYYHCKGRLLCFMDRNFIKAAQTHDYVLRLTEDQIDAIDMLEAIAAEDGFFLDLEWARGTFAFVHNHQIFHSRTAYEDFDEPERRRHNLRLWLSAKRGWELPGEFAERYGEIAIGKKRGGIVVPGMTLTTPFEAE